MLKAVLFDMDGTIIDSDLMIVYTWCDLYRKFKPGYKPHLADLLSFSGPPLDLSLRKEFPDIPVKETLAYYEKRTKGYYDDYVSSFKAEKEVLETLKERGLKLGVVTNKARSFADYSLEVAHLEGLFDLVIGGDEVMRNKPDPEGIYSAMGQLGVSDKQEVVYVGDTIYDYEAAKRAQVPFLMAKWCLREPLEGLKNENVCSSWQDLLRRIINGSI